MLRWLSRYVKQINIYGVGIELREISAEEALPLLNLTPVRASPADSADAAQASVPLVRKQDYICVSGVSASAQRIPRELDLMLDGDEIQFHVHNPDGTQPKVWAGRRALQESLGRWKNAGKEGPITVAGRTARKEAEIVFVVEEEGEVEVQAGWWIWAPRQDVKAALEELGIRVPWQ
jgi:hypothetical protein